jgi:hypothetical protein
VEPFGCVMHPSYSRLNCTSLGYVQG